MKIREFATKNKKKKQIELKPVHLPRSVEAEFQKEIRAYNQQFKEAVRQELLPKLETFSQLTRDGIGEDVDQLINNIKNRFDYETAAKVIASKMVTKVAQINGKKTVNVVEAGLGVDLDNILQSENLSQYVELQSIQNAELIKSVPDEAINDIRRIVLNGLSEGERHEEIAKKISGYNKSSVFNKTNNRIKTIARTETAKINSQITNKRLENIGVTRAIWDATRDSRVRTCHLARDGKEFDINKGLYSSCDGKTIKPGQEINCRCVARAIIE